MQALSAIMAWSLRNRPIIVVATLLLVIFGVQAARKLPIDAVPDLTNVQVQIITAAPALSPVEIEQYVTVPVERAMAGVPRVTDVRSISKYGLSVVTIVFDDKTDIYFARQLVSERMRAAAEAVPAQYGRPEMGPISTALGEIYQFVVRGEGYTQMQLEELLDWYIGPQLRTVRGVVETNSFGGENKEYQVVIDPQRLQALRLSVREVEAALERSNGNAGGGYIERNREQIVIGSYGIVDSLGDLESVVVGATQEGTPMTLGNVGEVRYGPKLRGGAASMNAQGEVVIGVALMLKGENSRTVTEAVKAKIESLRPSLPKGVRIDPFYDRAALVNRTIHTVVKNLLEGAALVMLVLFVLLGDLRGGLVVAATIPLAMLVALIAMQLSGASGNLMSLGAIDFGLIVDGAVIIVENAVRRLGEARRNLGRELTADERTKVVHDAAVEVRAASVFGEAIIAIVYLPILTLRGIEGKLFQPMASTVLFAIGGAFVLSLTVVPVLASYLLRPSLVEHETWIMRKAHAAYRPLLHRVLRHRAVTLTVGVLLLAGGVALFSRLGAEFVPTLDEGDLLVEARRLPGISLTESLATEKRLQQAVLGVPEVSQVISRTGAPEVATDPMGIEQSDVYVLLKPRNEWRSGVTKGAIGDEVAKAIEEAVPEVAAAISQPIQMRTNELIAGARSDVAVQVYGPDLGQLQELADQIAAAVKGVRGAVDVRATQAGGLRYLRIVPDRARLARYGLTVDDVNLLTEMIAVGHRAGVVFEGDRRFDLMVKLKPIGGGLESVKALPLEAANGLAVPLGDVADISLATGPSLVNRDQQSRRITIELNVRGRDLVSVVDDARRAVAAAVQLPTGYRVTWGGQFENFLSARGRLLVVVPLSLALILFMLWLAFRALKPAILIFLNIPFAIVGGILALWIRDIPFSISAGVGFVALFGVAVLNGLVLVSFIRHLEGEGKPVADAIEHAAELRLRPVLMTALVASLGFLPMALSHAPGSEVQRPLATVVIGGLVSATALTLVLFPAVYSLAARRLGAKDAHQGNG